MRRARSISLVLLALALPLLPGCSLFRQSTRSEIVDVVVDNNLPIPTPLTVYVITDVGVRQVRSLSDIGARHLVGNVSPGRRTSLHFRSATISGNYRLVAQMASQTQGEYLVSNAVALTGGETVMWDIRNNVILLAR
jgi:hypothetical protein